MERFQHHLGDSKLVLEGISKTDQNQSCRWAFLFCPQVSAKKCVVLANLYRQSAYTGGQQELDSKGFAMDEFSWIKRNLSTCYPWSFYLRQMHICFLPCSSHTLKKSTRRIYFTFDKSVFHSMYNSKTRDEEGSDSHWSSCYLVNNQHWPWSVLFQEFHLSSIKTEWNIPTFLPLIFYKWLWWWYNVI